MRELGVSQNPIEGARSLLNVTQTFAKAHYFLTMLGFALALGAAATFAIPLVTMLSLCCGALLGFPLALIIVVPAVAIGDGLAAAAVRYGLASQLRQPLWQNRLASFQAALAEKPWLTIIGFRFTPMLPFFLINWAVGLSSLSIWRFMLYTGLGIIPIHSLLTYSGGQIGSLANLDEVISLKFLIPMLLLATLSLGRFFWLWRKNLKASPLTL